MAIRTICDGHAGRLFYGYAGFAAAVYCRSQVPFARTFGDSLP